MKIEKIQNSAEKAADLMRSLSHEKRLMLLCQLVEGEKSVGALATALGITQANASQQLALLRKDGLVQTRREGQTIYYSLAGHEARRVIEVLYELYCEPVSPEKQTAGTGEDDE
ncbi:ArsR/SmtB family transcription factor [Luteithermobacter gelatinilyticus]|uniref:ArsR/SmtB family transcription factor n=1 Tax=Luteithermobacter gelatinilyticus TaxID=2582913 RepID=UPI001106D2EC|nr:metalloregulator ArsR/SmtB family transcription factor [Luteithermobacter gelatinilyticus]|tara:strand:- start:11841 stop:12182 length:342 start_codon:yes stop_codon:yes gene_type:complete